MHLRLLLGLISLIWIHDAAACSCMNLLTEEKIDRAAYVFRARITSAEWTPTGPESGKVKAGFEVLAVLKGNPQGLTGLHTVTGLGDCGVPIVIGWEYVFFLTAEGEANSCGGTMPRHGIQFGNTGEWLEFVRRYGLGSE